MLHTIWMKDVMRLQSSVEGPLGSKHHKASILIPAQLLVSKHIKD